MAMHRKPEPPPRARYILGVFAGERLSLPNRAFMAFLLGAFTALVIFIVSGHPAAPWCAIVLAAFTYLSLWYDLRVNQAMRRALSEMDSYEEAVEKGVAEAVGRHSLEAQRRQAEANTEILPLGQGDLTDVLCTYGGVHYSRWEGDEVGWVEQLALTDCEVHAPRSPEVKPDVMASSA